MCHKTRRGYRWIVACLVWAAMLVCPAACGTDIHGTVRISSDPDVGELDDPFDLPPPPRRK